MAVHGEKAGHLHGHRRNRRSGRGRFQVGVGDKHLTSESPVTGDYGKFTTVALGKIAIPAAGKTSLGVKAVREGWQPLEPEVDHVNAGEVARRRAAG